MQRQPTLLNSCASAATAAEARFRIDYPDTQHRAARVIALDEGAADLVRRLAAAHWRGGHFLVFEAPAGRDGAAGDGSGNGAPGSVPHAGPGPVPGGAARLAGDALLRTSDGTATLLSSELEDADSAVVIATAQASAAAASVIGDACAARRISCAGLVLAGDGDGVDDGVDDGDDDGDLIDDVVASLRPNAMVLVVLHDQRDVPELLSALRV